MNLIHDVMQINVFPKPIEKTLVEDDVDILADIVHAHSVEPRLKRMMKKEKILTTISKS